MAAKTTAAKKRTGAAPKRFSHREDDPEIRGGPELYGSARGKLRKVRGKASDHKCKCGETATAWVFTPKKGAEVWVDPGGLRFSKDPADYTAMCADHLSAHRKKAKAAK